MIDKWIFSNFDFLKLEFFRAKGIDVNTTQANPREDQFSAAGFRKPKKELTDLEIGILQQAIADEEIKNFWFCEPLRRWMVLYNDSGQSEVAIFVERKLNELEAIADETY
jgi:hypothetical protein